MDEIVIALCNGLVSYVLGLKKTLAMVTASATEEQYATGAGQATLTREAFQLVDHD